MPFSFSMPRGSSALFAVTLRDKAAKAIDVSGAEEWWLVVADAVNTVTGELGLKVALTAGSQKGYVWRRLLDDETVNLEEKEMIAQVKVKFATNQTLVIPDEPFSFTLTAPVEDVP